MLITVPHPSLVVMVGATSSGKTTFARRHFATDEVLSSDAFRASTGRGENDMAATDAAFDELHRAVAARLAAGLVAVLDATNVQPISRAMLLDLARSADVPALAVVLDLPERVLRGRHAARTDRPFGPGVIRTQRAHLRRSLADLSLEGFANVSVLCSVDEVDRASVVRPPDLGARSIPRLLTG